MKLLLFSLLLITVNTQATILRMEKVYQPLYLHGSETDTRVEFVEVPFATVNSDVTMKIQVQGECRKAVRLTLTKTGPKKIGVIKAIREATGLGLADAKALADNPPKPIKTDLTNEAAEILKAAFEKLGAEMSIE